MKHKFHTVKIKEIQRETSDTITVEFDIPDHLESSLLYEAGQYLTLRTQVNGEEMQRPYSLSTAPYEKKGRFQIRKRKMVTLVNLGKSMLKKVGRLILWGRKG